MNIYDTANNLAKEIKESEEYKAYSSIKEEISKDTERKSKLDEFEKLRYMSQLSAMQGQKEDEEKINELQNKYAELISDDKIKEYFEAEMKFNVMIADVNKIIAEAVQDVL